eukprot:TRINITY_DN30205_c0_g1_i1.p1 TRINITY_DN30205_c0_g1~~TRINITY_DN30205_c0_g1_i1.p1  ORF type:complete len:584 (+),score=116.74 TRINITY_DN30205_c0_g1_i1:114-1754(+)
MIVNSSRGDRDETLYRLVSIEDKGKDPLEVLGIKEVLLPSAKSPPTPSGRSSSASMSPPPSNYRTEWVYQPSCEYCGKQMAELEVHMQEAHYLQLAELQKLEISLNHKRQHSERHHNIDKELKARWGTVIARVVTPVIEDKTSYGMRKIALESLQFLVRNLYPGAKVYLFGSGVTGLAVKESDTDAALDINDDRCSNVAEEIPILDNLYNTFTSDQRHPWVIAGHGHEDFGLKKILRTRVPIVGNSPSDGSTRTAAQVSKVVVYHPSDIENSEEEAKMVATEAGVAYGAVKREGDRALVTCTTEVEAVKFLTKCNRVELNNKKAPPLVYTTRWDMSCRLFGVRNSNLLRMYLQKPHLRMAAVAVKIWSKKVKINDPRVGLLSSYAVALMFVYYLIHTKQVEHIDPESVQLETCPQIPDFIPPPRHNPEFSEKVGEAFLGFVNYYACVFNWEDDVIAINTGEVVKKQSIGWTSEHAIHVDRGNSVHYYIRIQDPYELADPTPWGDERPGHLNVTRKITKHRALKVHCTFIKTWNSLKLPETKVQTIF